MATESKRRRKATCCSHRDVRAFVNVRPFASVCTLRHVGFPNLSSPLRFFLWMFFFLLSLILLLLLFFFFVYVHDDNQKEVLL